jgi:phage antirepressor YoqD-like protein
MNFPYYDTKYIINRLHRQIKEALGRKNRSVAQRLLAHQKMLAKQLENRLAQLLTLDGILIRLQQTESEADVVKSFRVGAETLQQWMRDNGMTVDRVEETVQQVENVFEDYDEVEQAIESHTMPALSSLEDAELEAELDALLLAEQQVASPSSYSSIGQKQLIESLPSVPATLELQQQQTDASAMARKNEALLE